jgi:hypothetical protein
MPSLDKAMHERIFRVKRALTIAVLLASAAAMSGQALAAATVNQYGSVKLQWNVAVAMNAVVHTNYTSAFANGGATATVGSNGSGSCTAAPTGNSDLNLVYGTITPSFSGTQGCDYQNAVGVSVQTNDTNGFAVYEYLDTALPAGTNLCAFANDAAKTFPVTAASSITTTQYGTAPTAYSGACASGGAAITNAGTIQNAGVAPAQPSATYAGEYASAAADTGQEFLTYSSAAGTAVLGGEDLQLNVSSSAASGTALTDVMTLQFVAN